MSQLEFSFDDSSLEATVTSFQGDTGSMSQVLPIPSTVIDNSSNKTFKITGIAENALNSEGVPNTIYLPNTITNINLPSFQPDVNVFFPAISGNNFTLLITDKSTPISLTYKPVPNTLNPFDNGLKTDTINLLTGGTTARLTGSLATNGTFQVSAVDNNGNILLTLNIVAVPKMVPNKYTPVTLVTDDDSVMKKVIKVLLIILAVVAGILILYYIAVATGLIDKVRLPASLRKTSVRETSLRPSSVRSSTRRSSSAYRTSF